MCGVVGLFRLPGTHVPDDTVRRMTDAVAHRGPDGSGTEHLRLELNEPWRVGLGHRRLAILDLSPAGRQPMTYRGYLWISFNGEIYNYLELREELETFGHRFQSHTDTEVILAAYDQWGLDCFHRLRGMWGLVLVDLRDRRAVMSRDRMGIKPLYIARAPGILAAVSEIKQLTQLPQARLRPNDVAIRRYLATGYENSSSTFFADVLPVAAGTFQVLNLDTLDLSPSEPFWFPERVEPTITRVPEAAERFRLALHEAVRLHMRSDVPVGCALSGGLDSSAVSATIRSLENGHAPAAELNTFSAVFPGDPVDERFFVEEVLKQVSATPHFVSPTPDEFVADLDEFTWKHDEPVGSLSQYAGYAVARLTRQAGIAVTLNGQGGDEVLSGYWQCYFVHLQRLARQFSVARLAKQLGGALLPGGNPELVRQVPGMLSRYMGRRRAPALARGPLEQVVQLSAKLWRVYEIRELFLPRLLKWDDRNFMAFSVEGRYPFLDHPLIELCLSFSPAVLFDRGWTKEPLRRGLSGMLPQSILRRRSKVGFETPQERWLAGPLTTLIDQVVGGDSPAWQYTDAHQSRALAEKVRSPGGVTKEEHQALLRIVFLDRWLRKFALA